MFKGNKKVGNYPWKGKHGPLLIAEIGGNHEGNFDYAMELAQLAVGSGVDYVKFQLYQGSSLVNPQMDPHRKEHFKKFELTKQQHIEIAEFCLESGVGYMASVWDLEMLEWVDSYLDIYKIGSGDMTAYPLLKAFAEKGKPIILSTGLACLEEVLDAVDYIQRVNSTYQNANQLALLQCTTMYPIGKEDANLLVMDRFREKTNLAVGYSDHTEGLVALKVAAARGADVLEFHFTDTREGKHFRDHKVSLTQHEVKTFCEYLRDLNSLLGDGVKRAMKSEVENGHVISFRRAVYLKHDIRAGSILTEEDFVYLRPMQGIDSRAIDELLGKQVICDCKALAPLRLDQLKTRT